MRKITPIMRRWLGRAGRDRRWISDARERTIHDDLVRDRLGAHDDGGNDDMPTNASPDAERQDGAPSQRKKQ